MNLYQLIRTARRDIEAYKAAYAHVYYFRPTVTFDGEWVHIVGQDYGINLKRLRELTRQLKYRQPCEYTTVQNLDIRPSQ